MNSLPTRQTKGIGPPLHPAFELLGRYASVFKASWRARKPFEGIGRLPDELAFLPAAMSLQETPPHPFPGLTARSVCGLFTVAVAWLYFAEVDIVAVAQGRIKVTDGSKQVQPLEISVVKAIHVQDGEQVRAGQILIELDNTLSSAEIERVKGELQGVTSEILRSESLIEALQVGGKPTIPSNKEFALSEPQRLREQLQAEWTDIGAKQTRLRAEVDLRRAEFDTVEQQIAKLRSTLPMLAQRERDYKTLTSQGFLSQHAEQDRTLDRLTQEKDLGTFLARRKEALAAIHQAEEMVHSFLAESERSLRERQFQAGLRHKQLLEASIKARQRQGLTQLAAPVSGVVQQLAVHTAGGVVTPAQTLLIVVPNDAPVTAEVVLENRDVGFIVEGQAAEIKLEPFPYTRYGTVPARVKSVSADAVYDEKRGSTFPVVLELQESYLSSKGKKFRLTPGMNLTAEMKTGKRRVIDFLLQPLEEHSKESFKER
jgi:hemolysin D